MSEFTNCSLACIYIRIPHNCKDKIFRNSKIIRDDSNILTTIEVYAELVGEAVKFYLKQNLLPENLHKLTNNLNLFFLKIKPVQEFMLCTQDDECIFFHLGFSDTGPKMFFCRGCELKRMNESYWFHLEKKSIGHIYEELSKKSKCELIDELIRMKMDEIV